MPDVDHRGVPGNRGGGRNPPSEGEFVSYSPGVEVDARSIRNRWTGMIGASRRFPGTRIMTTMTPSFRDVDLVGPFIRSSCEVFRTMLTCDCQPGAIRPVADGHQMYAVTSVIGLSGCLSGAISISVPRPVAIAILGRMTGIEAPEVDDFVRDAVGEIANMIGGTGKKELAAHYELQLGLPQVIVGEDYKVYSPRWARHYWLPLECELGPCSLDVGFSTTRGGG